MESFSGFGISNYRTFGSTPQYIAPLGKINLFAGQNNSGKSNILRAVSLLENTLVRRNQGRSSTDFQPSANNLHNGDLNKFMSIFLELPISGTLFERYVNKLIPASSPQYQQQLQALSSITAAIRNSASVRDAWFEYDAVKNYTLLAPTTKNFLDPAGNPKALLGSSTWRSAWSFLKRQSGESASDWISETLAKVFPANFLVLPAIYQLGAFRRVGASQSQYQGFDGEGLISRLAALERASTDSLSDKAIFNRICTFVQNVTDFLNQYARY